MPNKMNNLLLSEYEISDVYSGNISQSEKTLYQKYVMVYILKN